jgi:hypothetical protein
LATSIVQASNAGWAFAATDQGCEHYLLADAHGGNFGADFGDFSGDIASGNVRKRDRNIWQAPADPEIEMIEGAGADTDENFMSAEFGFGDVDILQNFGSAMLAEKNGFHDASELF